MVNDNIVSVEYKKLCVTDRIVMYLLSVIIGELAIITGLLISR